MSLQITYDEAVELLYNNKIKYINIKQLNNNITCEVLKYINKDIIIDLYNNVVDNINYGNYYLKGGIILNSFKNDILNDDIVINIEIDNNDLTQLKNNLSITKSLNNIPLLNGDNLFMDIKNTIDKYFNDISNVINNINLMDVIPLNILSQTQIIFLPYIPKILLFENIINTKLYTSSLSYVIYILPNSIIIRFFIEIATDPKCKIIDAILGNMNNLKQYLKFYLIDIRIISTHKPTDINILTIDKDKIKIPNNKYFLIDQLKILCVSNLTNNKIMNRSYRLLKLFELFKNEILFNKNKFNIPENKILLSKSINTLNNYYVFKNLVKNDKIIYYTTQLDFDILLDNNLISINFYNYAKSLLIQFIKYMDVILNILNRNVSILSLYEKINKDKINIDNIIETFYFNRSDINDYYDDEEYKRFVDILKDTIR
ncbi:hypothetical protein [Alphaentomopoxvirus acuprea]|uniref:Uncharacterized protein n=1 Tax=Alphaentomopoxvirus acuprea TaxID=62099 RepID=W6JLJ7_9POXV|nr:hypothetical protein BA82_gp141 [Anomala cuprea entomopoxvirus]BAO49501.1 hypothetical protein [Anomala cuprea entomopoxvirus]